MEYLLLTELTLPRLLLRVALRRPTCVVACISLLRGETTAHMTCIVRWLLARGFLAAPPEDDPLFSLAADFGDFIRVTDPFARAEPWLESFFRFAELDSRLGSYAPAYRHLCCANSYRHMEAMHLVHAARAAHLTGPSSVSGFDGFELDYARRHIADWRDDACHMCPKLDSAINLLLAAGVALVTLGWVFSRMRLRVPTASPVLIGVDPVLSGAHEPNFMSEVIGNECSARMIFRNRERLSAGKSHFPQWPCHTDTDALFTPNGAFNAVRTALIDIFCLYRVGRGLPVSFFRALVVLPFRRIAFRGLFHRFPVRFFWSRDDYNTNHIIRTQELRRIGAVSMGFLHGIPSICRITHQLRHLDYDIYYVLGLDVFKNAYAARWPKHMVVRAIGSSGLSREELVRLASPRPNNIACVVGDSMDRFRALDIIAAIAEAFPDRTVYVNAKSPYLQGAYGLAFRRLVESGPKNIVHHAGRAYEMFFQSSYMISGGSTLTAEAIQFGLNAFVLDLDPRWKTLFYREYPGLCVHSAEEAIDQIRAIEGGRYVYPRADYCDIIAMTGRVPWDVIRGDMGLSPGTPSFMPHLAFCHEPMPLTPRKSDAIAGSVAFA